MKSNQLGIEVGVFIASLPVARLISVSQIEDLGWHIDLANRVLTRNDQAVQIQRTNALYSIEWSTQCRYIRMS